MKKIFIITAVVIAMLCGCSPRYSAAQELIRQAETVLGGGSASSPITEIAFLSVDIDSLRTWEAEYYTDCLRRETIDKAKYLNTINMIKDYDWQCCDSTFVLLSRKEEYYVFSYFIEDSSYRIGSQRSIVTTDNYFIFAVNHADDILVNHSLHYVPCFAVPKDELQWIEAVPKYKGIPIDED